MYFCISNKYIERLGLFIVNNHHARIDNYCRIYSSQASLFYNICKEESWLCLEERASEQEKVVHDQEVASCKVMALEVEAMVDIPSDEEAA